MKNAREEQIRCPCGWRGRGYGGDPCPRCGSCERVPATLYVVDVTITGGQHLPSVPFAELSHARSDAEGMRRDLMVERVDIIDCYTGEWVEGAESYNALARRGVLRPFAHRLGRREPRRPAIEIVFGADGRPESMRFG